MVVVNRHRNTGVLTVHGHKYKHLVLMDSGGIAVTRLSEEDFQQDWKELVGYSDKDVAKRLLSAGERYGITKGAEEELVSVINR